MPIHGNPEWQCFFSIFLRFLPYSSKLLKSPQKIFFIFPLVLAIHLCYIVEHKAAVRPA